LRGITPYLLVLALVGSKRLALLLLGLLVGSLELGNVALALLLELVLGHYGCGMWGKVMDETCKRLALTVVGQSGFQKSQNEISKENYVEFDKGRLNTRGCHVLLSSL
jgi:hypothetical protein